MYATSVSEDGDKYGVDLKNPTWEQIKNAILALDGGDTNTIFIAKEYEEEGREDDTKEFMSIAGGGENQLYLCQIYSYECKHGELILYDPRKSWNEMVEIVQIFYGDYSAARCHNLDTILVAAETYSRFGLRDKSLHWGYFAWPEPESSQHKFIEIGQDGQPIEGSVINYSGLLESRRTAHLF